MIKKLALLIFLSLSISSIKGYSGESLFSWPPRPYIRDLVTGNIKLGSSAEFDQIINAIPEKNHYTQSSIIHGIVNEPFVITVDKNEEWYFDGLDYSYFSSIVALVDEGIVNFVLTPSKTTTHPLFFNVSWSRELPCQVVPPIYAGVTMPFVIEISK